MSGWHVTSSTRRRITATGLAVAALAIPVQIIGGADYPVVPPGLVILTAAAVVFLLAPWRWLLALAMLATLFISVGGVLAPNFRDQLGDPGAATIFAGSVLQVAGLVVAVVFGLASMVELVRGRRRTPDQVRQG